MRCRDDSLALLYLDIDDFKLYNQLYGNDEGDAILCNAAQIITLITGQNGTVYRVSGRFSPCFCPHYDGRRALLLANPAARGSDQQRTGSAQRYKQLTISGGICVYPLCGVRRDDGKTRIWLCLTPRTPERIPSRFFKGVAPVSHQIVERPWTSSTARKTMKTRPTRRLPRPSAR